MIINLDDLSYYPLILLLFKYLVLIITYTVSGALEESSPATHLAQNSFIIFQISYRLPLYAAV